MIGLEIGTFVIGAFVESRKRGNSKPPDDETENFHETESFHNFADPRSLSEYGCKFPPS